MSIFEKMSSADYEQILFMQDEEIGLKAITVIHDTTLGPALGGARYWNYDNEEDALNDAIRLARGMTYKNAASGLSLGGGKTVIIKDPNNPVSEEAIFRVFGRYVEGMGGRYITAPDVGTGVEQMDYIYHETDYVVGTSLKSGTSGNPAPSTANGILNGMKAAVNKVYGTNSLRGLTILLEGAGKVGLLLAERALADGAKVIATDIFDEPKQRAKELGCEVVDAEDLFSNKADIYAPCALGATVNDENIEKMKQAGVKIISGSANNQLAEDRHDEVLKEEGILYVPDYILNAGGAIQVADELNGGYKEERANKSVENIYNQIEKVFEIADEQDIPTHVAADRYVENRLRDVRKTRNFFVKDNKSIFDHK